MAFLLAIKAFNVTSIFLVVVLGRSGESLVLGFLAVASADHALVVIITDVFDDSCGVDVSAGLVGIGCKGTHSHFVAHGERGKQYVCILRVCNGFPGGGELFANISQLCEVRTYIVVLPAVRILELASQINPERSRSSFADTLEIVPPQFCVRSAFDTVEYVIWYQIHDEMFDGFIVVFPSHGWLDGIDVTAIEVSLSYRFAGQMVLPASHSHGDHEAVAICDPIGAIAGQPDYFDLHAVVHL